MNTITVWRGLAVDRAGAMRLRKLTPGTQLSTNDHGWWTTRPGVAEVYATTGEGIPVVIMAELSSPRSYGTPLLPKLKGDEVLTLINVTFL